MHIIAIAWIYVVSMMALTERSVIAGIMTFIMYCALPLGLVWFIFARKKPGTTVTGKKPQQDDASIQHRQTDPNTGTGTDNS